MLLVGWFKIQRINFGVQTGKSYIQSWNRTDPSMLVMTPLRNGGDVYKLDLSPDLTNYGLG
jgi:hypothetical protein